MFGVDGINWMIVFLRASGVLALFPLFSANNFPVRVRLALGALLAFLISPVIPAVAIKDLGLWGLVGWMVVEVGVGLLLGMVSRLVFYTIDFAGAVAAVEIGLSISPNPNPFSNQQSDTPGLILYFLASMIFLGLDMHHGLLLAFQKSYQYLPVGGIRLHETALLDLVNRTSRIFLVGVQMAAPIIAVAFIVNLVFSVLARAVPQMNVFTEAFPFRIAAGLLVFGLTLQLMAQHLLNLLRKMPEDILRVAQFLGGP